MALGDGKTMGDGRTSPFGDGGGTMAGNDFVKNPAGGNPGGRGNDFLTRPEGEGPTGATPTDFAKGGKGPQKSGEAEDLNPESEIRDGGELVPLIDRPDAGTGSIGNAHKPFKGF